MKKIKNKYVKEEHITATGIVDSCLPGTKFKVILDDLNAEVICSLSGKLRMNKIQITEEDSVEVEISPYDTKAGIIVWRNN
jgi:translation initiation factor IF-1